MHTELNRTKSKVFKMDFIERIKKFLWMKSNFRSKMFEYQKKKQIEFFQFKNGQKNSSRLIFDLIIDRMIE